MSLVAQHQESSGPLSGLRVLEFAGLGPAPFAAMLLADMGADVLRLERLAAVGPKASERGSWDLLTRGRRSAGVDLKTAEGTALARNLAGRADVLLEGFRPGVMERLGLGPDTCLADNPALVYSRMTGFGQRGPLADAPGHDINYIALSGALEPLGRAGAAPTPPMNLLGDFGGGATFLVMGVLAALWERTRSGRGQVVDAAMVDGSAILCTMLYSFKGAGMWPGRRGENLLDTGAPFYDVYATSDGKYVAVGALEPQFYEALVKGLELEGDPRVAKQLDRAAWPAMRAAFAERFASRTRDSWREALEGTDACVTPVLSPEEAAEHPHNVAREGFFTHGVQKIPAPAPRFERTPARPGRAPRAPGADTDEALAAWGIEGSAIAALRASQIIR